MKRISIGFLLTFILLILFSACQENKWMDWKIMNDQWYAKHQTDSGFVTTSTGLCYKAIYQGNLRRPNPQDIIYVKYKGSLIDGSVFEEATTTLSLNQTIPGWQEGIRKMNTGGTFRFYIPSKLGYNTSTSNNAIPPNSVLIFDIELLNSY